MFLPNLLQCTDLLQVFASNERLGNFSFVILLVSADAIKSKDDLTEL